jgi:hypothetical protein
MSVATVPDYQALTDSERAELTMLEARIKRGLKAYYEVGEALLLIRSKRLYRSDYTTFKEYLLDRWGYTRQHAARLIDASEVVGILSPIGDIPTNEAQARELVGLTPEQTRVAWEVVRQTAPDGNPTAAHTKSVVTVLQEITRTGAIDDGTGIQIKVADVFKHAVIEETYERMQRQSSYIKSATQNASKKPYKGQGAILSLLNAELHLQLETGVLSDLKALLGKRVIITIREATDVT